MSRGFAYIVNDADKHEDKHDAFYPIVGTEKQKEMSCDDDELKPKEYKSSLQIKELDAFLHGYERTRAISDLRKESEWFPAKDAQR